MPDFVHENVGFGYVKSVRVMLSSLHRCTIGEASLDETSEGEVKLMQHYWVRFEIRL